MLNSNINAMMCSINVSSGQSSSMPVSITPRLGNSLPVSIKVNPYNTMNITEEVTPPPQTVLKCYPVRDTFIREGIPRLNYGKEQEMLIGNAVGEKFRSLVSFNASQLPENVTIISVILKLNGYAVTSPTDVDVYTLGSQWDELSATWMNQSIAADKVASFTNVGGPSDSLTASLVDILDYLKDPNNNGLLLKAPNETVNYSRLCTREGLDTTPVLEITYFDPVVKSPGRTTRPASITVRRSDVSAMQASINIASHNVIKGLPVSITVPTHPDSKSLNISITVRARSTPQDMQASIFVPLYSGINSLVASIIVKPRSDFQASIFVPKHDDSNSFNADIAVRVKGSDGLVASITVPTFPGASDLTTGITVRRSDKSPLTASITVPLYDNWIGVLASIMPRYHAGMQASINVRQVATKNLNASINTRVPNDLPTSIIVTSGWLPASIFVPYHVHADLSVDLDVRIRYINDMVCTITVAHSNGAYGFIM